MVVDELRNLSHEASDVHFGAVRRNSRQGFCGIAKECAWTLKRHFAGEVGVAGGGDKSCGLSAVEFEG